MHERLKLIKLGTPKQMWIAYHARGMTAMLQLCYHKGGSKYTSLAYFVWAYFVWAYFVCLAKCMVFFLGV